MRAPKLIKQRTDQSGFTIIEIMIVLAVASLIMLIVFLAVPALQRSARNTNRTSDSTKIGSAVNECLSNFNNTVSDCNRSTGASGSGNGNNVIGTTLDLGTIRQLKTVAIGADANGGTAAFPSDANTAWVFYGEKCTTDGAGFQAGNSQQFVVLYNNESTSGITPRCISG